MTPSPARFSALSHTPSNASAEPGDNALLTELKTRARLHLNAARAAASAATPPQPDDLAHPREPRLRDSLNEVSREVGFSTWDHARRILGGLAEAGDDMGAFWHAPRCNGLLSHWFAQIDQAREGLAAGAHWVLLPYRRQFVVVDEHYLRELGLSIDDGAWAHGGRDLQASYGGDAWLALCQKRLFASRGGRPVQSLA